MGDFQRHPREGKGIEVKEMHRGNDRNRNGRHWYIALITSISCLGGGIVQ